MERDNWKVKGIGHICPKHNVTLKEGEHCWRCQTKNVNELNIGIRGSFVNTGRYLWSIITPEVYTHFN